MNIQPPHPPNFIERIHTWYDQQNAEHPETSFAFRASLLVFLIMSSRSLIEDNDFLLWIFIMSMIFLPMYYIIFCLHRWRSNNVGFLRNLWEFARENITVINTPVVEHKESYRNSAWVTYNLILVNEIIFYFVQPAFPKIHDYLLFIPLAHEWWSLPFALLGSMFLHTDGWHLWGNMLFLWAVGTVIERRIGWKLFLGGYLISGVIASLLAADVHYYLMNSEIHALGASGAIAGTMGMFMVRCYFKQMIFPIPIFGVLPISFKIRMNSMTFIGLFFAIDVQAGFGQIVGDFSNTGHWAHIGGMYAGMLIAATRRLENDADIELSEEMGMSAIQQGVLSSEAFDQFIGLDAAEKALRKVLTVRPDDVTVMLQLARTRSHLVPDPEAKELYGKVLTKLVGTNPKEAVEVFREYYKKFMDIVPPETQYRLIPHILKEGDYQRASIALEMIITHPETSEELKEKAMYNCARVFDEMDLPDAARDLRIRFLELFPLSASSGKIKTALDSETN